MEVFGVVWGLLLAIGGVVLVVTGARQRRRHPEWSVRYGPHTWMWMGGGFIIMAGLLNVWTVLERA